MRLRLVSIASFALLSALAACGDDSGTEFIDASVPDAVPPPPDAEPFVCTNPTPDDCNGVCVDLDSSEATCGTCETSCTGGEYCNGGDCECPAAFVAANPSFVFEQIDGSQIPDTVIGIGVFSNGGGHVLATAYSTLKGETEVGVEYTFDADPLTMPLLGAGYNVNVQTQQLDSAFAATAGTIEFTEICDVGFSGVATDVTFSGVESLFNPVIVPGGCTFDVASVTFSYGEPCPAP